MKNSGAIGVFDSGVGGLTVVKEAVAQLPGERIIYFGDTAHVPYGPKSKEELLKFADDITNFLDQKGIKMLLVACNTSSSISIESLREKYSFPIVGMVIPGSRGAIKATKNKRIGIIATEATVKSKAYEKTLKSLDDKILVFGQPCPRFVPLVEAGLIHSEEAREAAKEYLKPLLEEGIDTLVYGCTHYPFLQDVIFDIVGPGVNLVDPAFEAVKEAKEILVSQKLLNLYRGSEKHEFYASGDTESFHKVGKTLVGDILEKVDKVCLD